MFYSIYPFTFFLLLVRRYFLIIKILWHLLHVKFLWWFLCRWYWNVIWVHFITIIMGELVLLFLRLRVKIVSFGSLWEFRLLSECIKLLSFCSVLIRMERNYRINIFRVLCNLSLSFSPCFRILIHLCPLTFIIVSVLVIICFVYFLF